MTRAARSRAASRCRNRPPARCYGATGSLVARGDGLARLSAVFRGVLEMDDAVVTEELEQPVLRRQIDEGLLTGVELLVDRVLRYVDQVTRGELPARRLFRDPRVVLVLDLGLDIPLQAVPAAGDDVDGLVGHVPVLSGTATRGDLLLIEVEAVRARVGPLMAQDRADPSIARRLPLRV